MTPDKIALILDSSGRPAPLTDCTAVCLFENSENHWGITDEVPVRISFDGSVVDTSAAITELVLSLGRCRVVAGSEVRGIVYNVFDRLGFHIFEIGAVTQSVLDGIAEELLQEAENVLLKSVSAAPVETETPGYFMLDLIALQRAHPEVSSKKALTAFLKNAPFISLTLRSSHLPPWLALDPTLEIASALDNSAVVSVIRKRTCT